MSVKDSTSLSNVLHLVPNRIVKACLYEREKPARPTLSEEIIMSCFLMATLFDPRDLSTLSRGNQSRGSKYQRIEHGVYHGSDETNLNLNFLAPCPRGLNSGPVPFSSRSPSGPSIRAQRQMPFGLRILNSPGGFWATAQRECELRSDANLGCSTSGPDDKWDTLGQRLGRGASQKNKRGEHISTGLEFLCAWRQVCSQPPKCADEREGLPEWQKGAHERANELRRGDRGKNTDLSRRQVVR
ncbi:hypothetical protein C8R44DRAFT_729020 [Mycena epipterygia]|nr:hypothetical protein C8R44DRAFT_729020 [Mycena epipterygia]